MPASKKPKAIPAFPSQPSLSSVKAWLENFSGIGAVKSNQYCTSFATVAELKDDLSGGGIVLKSVLPIPAEEILSRFYLSSRRAPDHLQDFLRGTCRLEDDAVTRVFDHMGARFGQASLASPMQHVRRIHEDPYEYLWRIGHAGFGNVDKLYLTTFGGQPRSVTRIDALLGHSVEEHCKKSGDCHATLMDIFSSGATFGGVPVDEVRAVPESLEEPRFFRHDYQDLLFTPRLHVVETELPRIFRKIMRMDTTPRYVPNMWGPGECYDADQDRAVSTCLGGGLVLVNGRAGSGKTQTIQKVVCHLPPGSFHLMAFTGAAAKNAALRCGVSSTTIHSFVSKARAARDAIYRRDNGEKIDDDALERVAWWNSLAYLVGDEASMISEELMYEMLKVLPPCFRGLLLFGDDAQLPPIGPSEPFRAICTSKAMQQHVVTLTQNHRQREHAEAVEVLRGIADGMDLREVDGVIHVQDYDGDGCFGQHAIDGVCRLVSELGPLTTQVIAYTNGVCDSVNNMMQPLYNPNVPFESTPGSNVFYDKTKVKVVSRDGLDYTIRKWGRDEVVQRYKLRGGTEQGLEVGDRVILLENDHARGLVNGSRGTIESFQQGTDVDGSPITICMVRFDSGIFNAAGEEEKGKLLGVKVTKVVLAYCCTVHKYQGLQKTNIIYLSHDLSTYVDRRLVYTACSRFVSKLFVMGNKANRWRLDKVIDKPIKDRRSVLLRLIESM